MAVKIRLARRGAKKRPFYHIVAADVRAPRDGKYIEKLGTYNPLLSNDDENRVTLNTEAVQKWLGTGAQPTERVAKLLGQAGLIDRPKIADRPNKSKPSQKTLDRIEEKKEKAEAAKQAADDAAAAPAEEATEAPAEEAPAAEAEAPAEEEAKDA